MWYLAQAFGIVAMIISFLSFQGNTKKHIILFQMTASALFSVHFGLLTLVGEAALTGMVLNIINVAKCAVFCFSLDPAKKWASVKIWTPIFLIVNIVSGILTWTVWYSILPVIGVVFSTLAFVPKNTRTVRLLHLPSSPCWLVYNILTAAWPAVATECFALTSLIIAFVRFDILGQDESTGKGKRADKSGDIR